ncbi:hypothetical protein ACE1TF_11455 [Geomicrobium sp. JSM 1781026]|nr:hypothetical protein [Geomicrobium sp. JCM 19037]
MEFVKMTELSAMPTRCQDCGEVLPAANDSFFTQCERCLRNVEHE